MADPRPYADAAALYRHAGWRSPLPVDGKWPPPSGFTGHDGADVTLDDIERWTRERGHRNIAIRLPADVVGIDVDAHEGRAGAESLAAAEAALGPLPPTVRSTARDPAEPSGIRFYRVPPSVSLRGAEKRFRAVYGEGVDIIRHDHRYAVVWPSVHPATATMYRWYVHPGQLIIECPTLPRPADLPDLPAVWVEFLTDSVVVVETVGQPADKEPRNDDEHHHHHDPNHNGSVWDRTFTADEARAFVAPAMDALRNAPSGSINNRLNDAAITLNHFIPEFLTRAEAATALMRELAHTAYDGRTWRAETTIASGLSANTWKAVRGEASTRAPVPASADHPAATEVAGVPDETVTSRVVDLGPFLDGTFVAPQPSVGAVRDDGRALLYPQRWHTVVGLTAAGKSWLALWHAKAAMEAGGGVAYLHFEEALPVGTLARLRAMGCPDEVIRRWFAWLDCSTRWTRLEFLAALESLGGAPALVVLDGINAACAAHGWPVDKPEAIGAYRSVFVAPAVHLGAAVLSLGHPPKARDRQGERHGFGSTAWLDEVDGVAYRLVASRSPIGRGRTGHAALYSVKDRYGEVERHGQAEAEREAGWYYQGSLWVDDNRGTGVTLVTMSRPAARDSGGPTPRVAALREQIRSAILRLRAAGIEPSMSKIVANAGAAANDVRAEVDEMVRLGLLVESVGARAARLFHLPPEPEFDDPNPNSRSEAK